MRFLRILNLLLLPSFLAATDIQSYSVRLATTENGSGTAQATLVLTACTAGALNLPLGFSHPENLRLETYPAGVRLELGPQNGMTLLRFQLPDGIPSPASLRFSFTLKQVFQAIKLAPGEKSTLPGSSRIFRHAFVNTQETPIQLYRLEYLLPEGFMVQAIREQLPKPMKSEVGPRVLLSTLEGCQAATLQISDLHQGDDTSMVLELIPGRRSIGWLVAGLLLAGTYLFYFRDLVAKEHPDPTG